MTAAVPTLAVRPPCVHHGTVGVSLQEAAAAHMRHLPPPMICHSVIQVTIKQKGHARVPEATGLAGRAQVVCEAEPRQWHSGAGRPGGAGGALHPFLRASFSQVALDLATLRRCRSTYIGVKRGLPRTWTTCAWRTPACSPSWTSCALSRFRPHACVCMHTVVETSCWLSAAN